MSYVSGNDKKEEENIQIDDLIQSQRGVLHNVSDHEHVFNST